MSEKFPVLLLLASLLCFPASGQAGPSTSATTAASQQQTTTADLKARISKNPEDYHAWFELGVFQASAHQMQDAITAFRQVIALQPSLAEPHNNLAVIYNELGKWQEAVDELEVSLKLNPQYTTAYMNIGDMYVKLAADAYKKSLETHDRSDVRIRYSRLLHINDPEPALPEATPESAHKRPQPQPAQAVAAPLPTAQQPVSEAPAPTDVSHETIAGSLPATHDILSAVEAWRLAWSNRDTNGYFAAYADNFDPGSQFSSIDEWKKSKARIINSKKFIRVSLDHIEVAATPGDEFRVKFLQRFRSDNFSSDDKKELLLKQTPDGWKIVHEATL
ncbi:tetratricopeptide repeat protein [Mariprofundus erugo]|uniref:L,D-transpeptidase Cds6 family protein n=1 Tax=Mariprofundus erugo TaxID=2528639 RepID=UPI0010FD1E83|nr:tetratricopeptide repeat protein [Mariprofundus erugo]TLS76932.1 tetratricopeptide repeat protein [Mariprofundus erugo]